jgi:prolyl 4-hydroxylase
MSVNPITPELRLWIVEQATIGHPRDVMLKSMLASGWEEGVAVAALEQTADYLPHCQYLAAGMPPPTLVPEPMNGALTATVAAGDCEVRVLASLRNPRVIILGGLLADDECDQLVEMAKHRLVRAQTVDPSTGGNEVNEQRTSEGMFFDRGENPLVSRIEGRMAALLEWPIENGEGLQILRYSPGAEYKPHYDYFDPSGPGTPSILKHGGQRVGSLVCYLNTPLKGGATIFPDINLEVVPIKGNAVFFSYDRPHPATRSLHGGAPVLEGEKWVATKWLRERQF